MSDQKSAEMASSPLENGERLVLKAASKRQELVEVCSRCIEIAYNRLTNRYTKTNEKNALLHAVARLVTAENTVLSAADLDDLSRRVENLEKTTQKGS
jgi:hypothetical protein